MKKTTYIFVLIMIILCLLFLLKGEFVETFFKLGKVSSFIEKIKKNPKIEEKIEKSFEGKPMTYEGEEWVIEYGVPPCYEDTSPYPLRIIRSARIYWQQLKPNESIRAGYLATDTEVIYTGFFDGKNLTLTDSRFPSGPAKISGTFSDDSVALNGNYEVRGDMGLNGCEGMEKTTGPITGRRFDE